MKFKLPKKIQDKINKLRFEYETTGSIQEEGHMEAVLAALIDGSKMSTVMFHHETNEQFVVDIETFDKLDTLELPSTALGLRVSDEKESADIIYVFTPETNEMNLMLAAPEGNKIGKFMVEFFNNTEMSDTVANYLYNTHSLATTI